MRTAYTSKRTSLRKNRFGLYPWLSNCSSDIPSKLKPINNAISILYPLLLALVCLPHIDVFLIKAWLRRLHWGSAYWGSMLGIPDKVIMLFVSVVINVWQLLWQLCHCFVTTLCSSITKLAVSLQGTRLLLFSFRSQQQRNPKKEYCMNLVTIFFSFLKRHHYIHTVSPPPLKWWYNLSGLEMKVAHL